MKKILLFSIVFILATVSIMAIPRTKPGKGIMVAVDEYLSENADDYKSIQYIEAGYLIEHDSGLFSQKVKFRTKNKYGAYVLNEWYFTVTHNNGDSKVVSIEPVSAFKDLVNRGKLVIITWYRPTDGAQIHNKDLQKL
jgi:hypothetical protein